MLKNKFEMLEIEIPPELGINQHVFIHDDGFVSSFNKHYKELCEKYESPLRDIQELAGVSVEFKKEVKTGRYIYFETHHHLFYRNFVSPILNISVRAHEETHILQKMFLQESLLKKISKCTNRTLCLNDLRNLVVTFWKPYFSDFISSLGEFFVLYKKGIQLDEILNDPDIKDDSYKNRAKEGYNYLIEGNPSSMQNLYDLVSKDWEKARNITI